MKLENMPFAIFITVMVLAAISLISYAVSYITGVDFNSANELTVWQELFGRVLIGCMFLGFIEGVFSVIGLFALAMKAPIGGES